MQKPHVVIVGGGFGGLHAARALAGKPVRVTLIDKRNFHLFQPLLYQIATGGLSPGDIASPLRSVLRDAANIEVLMDEVIDIDPEARQLKLKAEPDPLDYDILILAAGGTSHYFGHDEWSQYATSLKSMEDALGMRRQIFNAFEAAEREKDPTRQAALMTFVIVGGGPTGVELAGALAELARFTLKRDFRHIDPDRAKILLVEAGPKILSVYPDDLSEKAVQKLQRRGVLIRTGTMVTDIREGEICLKVGEQVETLQAGTILWAAGVKASPLGALMAQKLNCESDKGGRIIVGPDCTVPGHKEIFVIGDLANFSQTPNGKPLPGVAPVAMQQGDYVADLILKRQEGAANPAPFHYKDKGSLAVIGINEAVADLGRWHLSGFAAWLIWALVHVANLVEFDNRMIVMLQWAWTYLTRRHGARLITGPGAYD